MKISCTFSYYYFDRTLYNRHSNSNHRNTKYALIHSHTTTRPKWKLPCLIYLSEMLNWYNPMQEGRHYGTMINVYIHRHHLHRFFSQPGNKMQCISKYYFSVDLMIMSFGLKWGPHTIEKSSYKADIQIPSWSHQKISFFQFLLNISLKQSEK